MLWAMSAGSFCQVTARTFAVGPASYALGGDSHAATYYVVDLVCWAACGKLLVRTLRSWQFGGASVESDRNCMQQQVLSDPHFGEQSDYVHCAAKSVYVQQNNVGQDTTALKVPGRSLSRVLVELDASRFWRLFKTPHSNACPGELSAQFAAFRALMGAEPLPVMRPQVYPSLTLMMHRTKTSRLSSCVHA